ncbi:MAG: AI-2E family transporter [Ignavibacteria bacterium]|nr:AI-2E family transporter [Ignavibacteria bacterium]
MTVKDDNKFLNVAAGFFLTGFIIFALKELSTILIPFVLALIISFVFLPFFAWLKSKRVPQPVAIVIILIIIIIIANIASVFIVASVDTFSSNFTVYEEKFLKMVNSLIVSLNLSSQEIQKLSDSLKISNLLKEGSITSFIAGFLTGFLSIFGDFLLILLYIIFILSELGSIRERIKYAFHAKRAERISETMDSIFKDVRTYISGKTIISLILGTLSGFVLWIFGVDFYFIWGFFIFITHYIPNIGAVFGITLPSILMFLQFDTVFTPILVTVILIALDNVIGNILEPKILGDRLNLSPLLLLLSLFAGEYVWGIVGMVLSVPIVSMLKIVFMNFKSTRPMGIMMSYKPSVIGKEIFKI